MTIQEYVNRITKRYRSGIIIEQLCREDLKTLIESSAPDVVIANGFLKTACVAPDYIITKNNTPVGYIEILPIDRPLDSQGNNKELDLYKNSLTNLILTNYLEFHLYRDGVLTSFVSIAEIQNGKIISKPGNNLSAEALIKAFYSYKRVSIGSPLNLARRMAGTAKLLARVIENAIIQDEQESKNQNSETTNTTLKARLAVSSYVLICDVSPKNFADIIAQTISFGMFAAQIYAGPGIEDFSRQNVAELIPLSYPFLRRLFQYLAGQDLDDRISWIINELATVFRATDLPTLLDDFKKDSSQDDPFYQFYENFLNEYDPKLRESREEFNKPEPIVTFLAQAVDDYISSNRY